MKKLFISIFLCLFIIGCSGGGVLQSMINLDVNETMEFKLYKSNTPQKYSVKRIK